MLFDLRIAEIAEIAATCLNVAIRNSAIRIRGGSPFMSSVYCVFIMHY